MTSLGFCALLLLMISGLRQVSCSRQTFTNTALLDAHGKYHLRWRYDERTIVFEAEVETTGYIGFGLSPSGSMAHSDMMIGGVENGKPYVQDFYTGTNREVHLDHRQDYHLEYAIENNTHTILCFSRDLNTCDMDDKIITESTVRVIWAYHSDDFKNAHNYHGLNRGRKSLRLLNPQHHQDALESLPFFEIKNPNITIPFKDTTYYCQIFMLPELKRKHHIIRIEPLIQKGHENLIHHILLYQCDSNLNESEVGMGHECYHPNMPDSFLTCESVFFAWAIGGQSFSYPDHVGLSIGTSNDPLYVMMEVHYDNPTFQEGLTDSSGLRLFYTSELRQFDAGVLETGVWVSLYHIIPPGVSEYLSEGHCTKECLQEVLDHEMPLGINVFAVLLHSHLAGRSLRTRHFRNGKELQLLAYDDEFDFNFQEFQYLKEERRVLSGDHLITECKYNTIDRKNVTWGGLSTRDEMCLSYLLYYPRIDLSRCESLPDQIQQLTFIGVKEIYSPVTAWPFIIKSPKKYRNLTFTDAMDTFKWSKKKGLAFNKFVLQQPINVRCSKHNQEEWPVHGMLVSPPLKGEVTQLLPAVCNRAPHVNRILIIKVFLVTVTFVFYLDI
ncbi:DBH-like monooxygenase protein 1 homolog [Erpetoichthys calabaricus]|uniref:DBH-like monooxygenase protein 1 homolog n=1 Tax=Erpetoichthys calabaricus TaxID=27687 RepID=UPI002234D324|nr:DBH-like monooxygenase protein 1 homolog [Erpetoichthys calabaricus]